MAITVGELIELLEQYDRDANVLIMEQPSWPFEYSIRGVVSREEIITNEPDEEDVVFRDGEERNDVFLLEGNQLRYGTKKAWDGW